MKLADYLRDDLVAVGVQAADSTGLIVWLADFFHEQMPQVDRGILVKAFQERERRRQAGLECGLAVPHALLAGIEQPLCAVVRLARPIEMGTLDGSPVRLVFAVVGPAEKPAEHVRLLARLARLCCREQFLERALAAGDARQLLAVIQEEDERHV